MATIRPFAAMRYDGKKIPHLSTVISQPYDRVRYGLQDQYYDLSPYNVVRIIKGRELPTDEPERPEGPNVYTRARAYYDLWLAEGVLVQEEQPALYVYHQTYWVNGQARTRKAFIAAFQLSPFEEGIVLPHERTHAGPKQDRLRLLRTTRVNLGQIFMLYPDPANQVSGLLDRAISRRAPDVDVVEMYEHDVRQELWVVTDGPTIQAVGQEMAGKRNLIIADGHHRYETALDYRGEMQAQYPSAPASAAFNYRMVALVGMDDPGLVILPTHREVYGLPEIPRAEIIHRVAPYCDLLDVPHLDACLAVMKTNETRHAFGLYADGCYTVLILKHPERIESWIDEDRSLAWKSLDVSIAHKILLQRAIGLLAQELDSEDHLRYHREPSLAVQNVDTRRGNFCLLLNPTPIDQVKACAAQGERMPQKSTDFYPKMVTGLTMMPLQP